MNILIAGVGGQGSLLASKLLGELYMRRGLDVKVSEVHGMSQRGGSVVTYVRAGKSIAMPLVPEGQADLLIAMEALEALRWRTHVKPGGSIVAGCQKIPPMPVLSGAVAYPDDLSVLSENQRRVVVFDALRLAREAGSVQAVNVVMLGAVSVLLDFDQSEWQAVLQTLPEKIRAVNVKAFTLGRTAALGKE